MKRIGNRRSARGFVLVAAAVTLLVLIGMLGLSTDLARMYIARNELQAYVDAAAIAAARPLDGTLMHLEAARTTAQTYPVRWDLGSRAVTGVQVSFATTGAGPYESNPASATGYRFVQVEASGDVSFYFLPAISGAGKSRTVRAQARAGQIVAPTAGTPLLPYSPDAHCISEPCGPADDFGFDRGQQYTLRWPPPGQLGKKNNWCSGDQADNYITPNPDGQRGYIDIGTGTDAQGIREAILNSVPAPLDYEIGDPLVVGLGNKGTESDALRERVSQDSDSTSQTYQEYYDRDIGNQRRLVIVPVNNPLTDTVLGFALFFLPTDICGNNNTASCCAEYVGPAAARPGLPAAGPPGIYAIRLIQ